MLFDTFFGCFASRNLRILNAFGLSEKFRFFDENGANYLIQLSKWDGLGAHLRVLRLQFAPEIPLLCHPFKYMGGSSRAKKLWFAEKFGVLLIHIVSCDGRARKCNFYRPSPLTQIASRRKIREKDVRTTANYGPFLAPMIVGRWDVVFL